MQFPTDETLLETYSAVENLILLVIAIATRKQIEEKSAVWVWQTRSPLELITILKLAAISFFGNLPKGIPKHKAIFTALNGHTRKVVALYITLTTGAANISHSIIQCCMNRTSFEPSTF
jgi:hypothetical protein